MKKTFLILSLPFFLLPAFAGAVVQVTVDCKVKGNCDTSGITTGPQSSDLLYTPLEPIPGVTDNNTNNYNIVVVLGNAFKLLLGLGALFAAGTLVYGGISYMVSEVVDAKAQAKKRMQAAVYGLLLLIGAWIILNTINPQLVRFNPNAIGTVTVAGSPQSQQPGGLSSSFTSGTIGDSRSAIGDALGNCRVACLLGTYYLSYDPNKVGDADVRGAIDKYKSDCETFPTYMPTLGSNKFGNTRKVPGNTIGAPERTVLVCQYF